MSFFIYSSFEKGIFYFLIKLNFSYSTVISNIIPTAKYDTYKVL